MTSPSGVNLATGTAVGTLILVGVALVAIIMVGLYLWNSGNH